MGKKTISFKIDHLDPNAQGVSKQNGVITFIPKTLPDEEGEAYIINEKKGVQFAVVESLSSKSPSRIAGNCPHFNQCYGCDYLHTPYTEEIIFKEKSLRKHLQKLIEEYQEIKVHQVKETTRYRNRMQLHYNKKTELLGQLDPFTQEIIPIPNCQLPMLEIQQKMSELYDGSWKSFVAHEPQTGHIELYKKDEHVSIKANTSYSHGGFTQVHPFMNSILKKELSTIIYREKLNKGLLELFAGNGNLTKEFLFNERYLLDFYTKPESKSDFYHYDLYKSKTLNDFKRKSKLKEIQLLLLDPPRSGHKDLDKWVKQFSPEHIIYVSCNAATLSRDIQKLGYKIQEVHLFDMFPGSSHYETLIWLTSH